MRPSYRVRLGLAAATACTLCGASLSTASADDDTPTREQIRSAQQDEANAARDVGSIKTELAAADQRVIDLGVEAGRLAEAYNGSVYRLQQARKEVRQRSKSVDQAKARLDRTTRRLSSALASNAAQSTELRNLATLLGENGPRELLEQTSGFDSIDDALAADLQRYDARKQVYGVLENRAENAVDRREDLAAAARQAKDAADSAVDAAEDAASGLRATRDGLIRELAEAQGVSEGLVRERQHDLARERRKDALEQAQDNEDEQAPPDDGDTTTPPPDEDTAPPPDDGDTTTPPPDETTPPPEENTQTPPPDNDDDGSDETPPPDDDANDGGGDDTPPPDNNGGNNNGGNNNGGNNNGGNNNPPPVKGGVEQAISYAKAQLGEPYVWAAAGPDSWDCSGLTMQAWASAGVSLPHWSVAQYGATTPVSVSSIRRGDLLFWSNGSSSSIYHVALYLGNGMMIHAPRPGRSVEIVSIYYWILPDLASRV